MAPAQVNVVSKLFPEVKLHGEVDEDIVRVLEHMLALAKGGELENIAVVGVAKDKSVVHSWVHKGRSRFTLMGALQYIGNQISRETEEGA